VKHGEKATTEAFDWLYQISRTKSKKGTEDKSSADTAQIGPDTLGLVLEKEFGTGE
jgi:hypothetical protein